MSKINVLDQHIANMIAAGEVVERPMGVVKELVENSIDARSSKIEVFLVNGGLDSIEVRDDGCGMDKVDATRAFMRHATSKIKEADDLWQINTMGFRGEALPSIASVSKLSMITSDGNDSTEVIIEYGKIIKAAPIASNQGTTIKVEGLFYKTPARLKHLKSANTELNMIIDLLQKLALANPDIAFSLYNDEKIKLSTNGSNNLQETIMAIYGLEVAKHCIQLNINDFDFEIEGFIVVPAINRSNKQYISCSLNNRIIKSYPLQKAIIDGYSGFMMPDKYPIVVINIRVDYQLVDVNVHPSKWEVRLSKEKQLYSLLTENIKKELTKHNIPNDLVIDHAVSHETVNYYQPIKNNQEPVLQQDFTEYLSETKVDRFSYLGQYHGKYILAFDNDNLYIVDQHAAMERCMYEKIQNDIRDNKVDVQPLLVPFVLELNAVEMNNLAKINELLACINLSLEEFSNNSVVIREIPLFFADINENEFLHDLITEIINDKKMSILDIRKEKIASLACHSSVKFNKFLTIEESKKLLSQLSECVQPFNCPHGRPTMITITDKQLEKEFKRV